MKNFQKPKRNILYVLLALKYVYNHFHAQFSSKHNHITFLKLVIRDENHSSNISWPRNRKANNTQAKQKPEFHQTAAIPVPY